MRTKLEGSLAKRLYQLTAARMDAASQEMPCSEAVFAVLTDARPDCVSYSAMAGLSNLDFLEAAFLLLLQRPVDDAAKKSWSAKLSLPRTEFQTAVLRAVLHAQEYQQHLRPLTGCPLPLADDAARIHVQVTAQPMPARLLRIYRKMPRPVQILAKKIAGKEHI